MKYFRISVVWSFTLLVLLIGPTMLAQAIAATSAAEAVGATPAAVDVWGNSFLWAFVSVWGMRWWREHPKLSGFTDQTALRIQRLIAAGIGFVNGLGITFVFNQEAGTLMIGGLFLGAIVNGGRQFLMQEFIYHSALKRNN